jgi:hypothetical protein
MDDICKCRGGEKWLAGFMSTRADDVWKPIDAARTDRSPRVKALATPQPVAMRKMRAFLVIICQLYYFGGVILLLICFLEQLSLPWPVIPTDPTSFALLCNYLQAARCGRRRLGISSS